jgi:hypothetical protein
VRRPRLRLVAVQVAAEARGCQEGTDPGPHQAAEPRSRPRVVPVPDPTRPAGRRLPIRGRAGPAPAPAFSWPRSRPHRPGRACRRPRRRRPSTPRLPRSLPLPLRSPSRRYLRCPRRYLRCPAPRCRASRRRRLRRTYPRRPLPAVLVPWSDHEPPPTGAANAVLGRRQQQVLRTEAVSALAEELPARRCPAPVPAFRFLNDGLLRDSRSSSPRKTPEAAETCRRIRGLTWRR